MVTIHGMSDQTRFLLDGTRRVGTVTLADVLRLHENFSSILGEAEAAERARVEKLLAELDARVSGLMASMIGAGYFKRLGLRVAAWFYGVKHDSIDRSRDRVVRKATRHIRDAEAFLKENEASIAGSRGEEAVIAALGTLPDSYHVFNDVCIDLGRAAYSKRRGEYVRRAQIDHVVVGHKGIYLLETKNWSEATFRSRWGEAHDQADRAGFAFWVAMARSFDAKPSFTSVVVTTRPMPTVRDEYVRQVAVNDLVDFIWKRQAKIDDRKVAEIANWLSDL